MWNRLILLAGMSLGACGFSKDLPPDAPGPTITIGFETGTSTADEKSFAHRIKVKISEPSTRDVTVKYQIEGGTAQPPADFDIVTPETMTIPAGETEVDLEIKVKADTDGDEPDETIDLILVEPVGAQLAAGAERHEVTIRSRALPRVSFEQAASAAQEPTDATFNVVLDEPSEFEITASFTVASPTAVAGTDYILPNGTVTFAPGETSKPITLDVLDDALDEDNEDVTVTLESATNAVIDELKNVHTHTILDDQVDPPPTVQFAAATSSHPEGAGTVNIVVTLSAVSGRTITVPFTINNASTATANTDYTITGTSITIPPGAMTGTIAVTIVQDTIDEPTETVIVNMGTATNATNTGIQTHTLSIVDDDLVCYGATPFQVCFDAPPTNAVTLPATLNTSSLGSSLCASTQPTNWTTAPQSQPAACFVVGATITVNTTTVQGTRPLVLVGATSITINGTLDASSNSAAGSVGPASPSSDCGPFGQNPNGNSSGGGGGAGGTFMTVGGNGGTGDGGSNVQAGTAAAAETAPVPKLRAGCNGQRGGNGSNGGSNQSGLGGRGGGAVYLVTGGTLTLASTSVINASGSGGNNGNNFSGGAGGGSGGMIKLHFGTLAASAGAVVMTNGGGGASGGDSNGGGSDGSDPNPATPQTAAAGGTGNGGGGGAGRAGMGPAAKGSNGGNNKGGGGGGGGGGYIQSNAMLTNVTVSGGVVQAP